MLGHLALSQDPLTKFWDTSHCPKIFLPSVGTLRNVPRHSVGTPGTVPRPHTTVLGHLALSQDPSTKCWDTSPCPKIFSPSIGTLRNVPRPSVGTPGTVPRPHTPVLGHLALSQDPLTKFWDTSHCPKIFLPSVGTLRNVPRHSVGTPGTVPRPHTTVLGHLALSQDPSTKCWDTSHCPKIFSSSLGTLRNVPRPSVGTPGTVPRPTTQVLGHFALSQDLLALSQDLPLKCWDTLHCLKTSYSNVGTLRTVPRPLTQVLEHFALSQDLLLKCWHTSRCPKTFSHCPKTYHSSVGTLHAVPRLSRTFPRPTTSHCPKTSYSSVGTLRTVPRPLTQVLGHFALSQDPPLKCWDASHRPKTSSLKCWDTSHCPKTSSHCPNSLKKKNYSSRNLNRVDFWLLF